MQRSEARAEFTLFPFHDARPAPPNKTLECFLVQRMCQHNLQEYTRQTNTLREQTSFFFFKLIKSGFWSLVSVFGCFWCVFFFFFFFFISCVNTVIPGVCSVKAVNRSLHLCIWKVSLLKYFCVFYYFWVFFFLSFPPGFLKNNKYLTNVQ